MENPNEYWNNYQGMQDQQDMDNFGELGGSWLSRIWNDITGKTAQNKEFAQQEYLQDKQNEYNDPVNQMKRQAAAGINKNLAAAGIAGAGNQSAQAPAVASNSGGTAAGVTAAAGALGSVAGSVQSLASAKETNKLLSLRADNIRASTVGTLEKAGLDHWNALSVATMLPFMEVNQTADFYLKMAQYDNTRAEYQNILDQHDLNLENIRLTGSKADEAAENARFAKETTEFFVNHGYRDDAPSDIALRNSIVSGRKEQAGAIAGAIESASYSTNYGAYKADADTAYERMYNSLKADADTAYDRSEKSALGLAAGNADYASYLNDLEIYKSDVTNFMQMWFALPDSLKGFAVQFLGKELYGGSAALAGFDKKPKYNPAKIDNTEFVSHTRNKYGRKQFSGSW